MPDSSTIRATTFVDTTGLEAGGDKANAVVRAQLSILQSQYRAAAADVKNSIQGIIDAEVGAAAAISAGNTQLAAQAEATAARERVALDSLISKELEVKAAMEEISASSGHAVSEIQAVSGTLRTLDGNGGIRAAERFLTSIPGLAPALQAVFPVVGLIALGEVLVRTFDLFTKSSKSAEDFAASMKRADEEAVKLGRDLLSLNLDKIKDTYGATAEKATEAANSTKLLLDTARELYLQEELNKALKAPPVDTSKATVPPMPGDIPKTTGSAQDIQELRKQLNDAQVAIVVDQQQSAKLSRETLASSAADTKKIYTNMAEDAKSALEAQKEWDREASEIHKAEESEARDHANELKLVYHEDVEAQLDRFKQQEDALVEENRLFLEDLRLTEEHDRRVEEADDKAVAEAKRAAEEQRRIALQQLEDARNIEREKAEMGKAQEERGKATSVGGESIQQQIQYLEQLKQIDAQTEAEALRHAIQMLQLDSLNNPDKAEEDQKRINQIIAQGQLQQYQLTTQIISLQTEAYRKFFTELNQEATKAFNDLLTHPKKFQADLQQIWTKMVTDFADKLLQMALKWAENEILMTITHQQAQNAQVQATATASAQKSAYNLLDTIKALNASAVQAAAGAYAAVTPIPIVGPILAPIAAAAAYAGVLALGTLASFDVGTAFVPKTQVALVHQGERIVDAKSNAALTQAMTGGAVGNGNTYNVTQHIHPSQGMSAQEVGTHSIAAAHAYFRRMNLKPL